MLEPTIVELATGKNFGMMSFQLPSGRIASHVMWVDANDRYVLINTEIGRTKYKALQADPRVTVTIWKRDNPYQYAEVRGRVAGEVRGSEARAHIDECAQRYVGTDYQGGIQTERVILQIQPETQRVWGL